jgi:hypothetical protein
MSERFVDPFVDVDHFIDKWWAVPIKMYEDGKFLGERFGGPLWKRKSPLASRGVVDHGLVDISGKRDFSTLWFECRWDAGVDFLQLFHCWLNIAEPNVGMLHVFTDAERNDPRSEAGRWFSTGSFGGPAKPGLPEIGWAMAYGPGYAVDVDVDRITGAGFKVSSIGGAQVVQVTDKLADVVDDYAYFSQRRAQLKSLFRPDLFWIK